MDEAPRFFDHEGREMVPLRCDLCGDKIGLRSPGSVPECVEARCYSCAATEAAEAITAQEVGDGTQTGTQGDPEGPDRA